MKKTKILCTVGPASMSSSILRKMHQAGMNGIRVNTAFGDFPQHKEIVDNVRRIGNIPILLDLKGPDIRVKLNTAVNLQTGDMVEIGNKQPFAFNYDIYDQLSSGDRVLINDGEVSMTVTDQQSNMICLIVDQGGRVNHGEGVNVPNKLLNTPAISPRDLKAISFAREHDVEFLALSFVRGKADLINLKKYTGSLNTAFIAKIENHQGVKNFEEILEESDGIMIARGDLGVEMDLEQIPLLQKQMLQRCNQEGKLAITATEMLESMTVNALPTRAEVSDVANAILDGTDTLMLSGETAIGKFPIAAVAMMTKIAKKVETSAVTKVQEEKFRNISRTISRSIYQISTTMPLDKIVTMTRTGYTAKMIARFKLRQPIIAITASLVVKKQLELYYGVEAIQFNYESYADKILAVARFLCSERVLEEQEIVLFTAGMRTAQSHASNLIEIHTIKELLELSS
jgi:pyruvate kinase